MSDAQNQHEEKVVEPTAATTMVIQNHIDEHHLDTPNAQQPAAIILPQENILVPTQVPNILDAPEISEAENSVVFVDAEPALEDNATTTTTTVIPQTHDVIGNQLSLTQRLYNWWSTPSQPQQDLTRSVITKKTVQMDTFSEQEKIEILQKFNSLLHNYAIPRSQWEQLAGTTPLGQMKTYCEAFDKIIKV